MTFFVYSIHVLTCFFLILVVLLQQGKGADLSVFGGGGTQTAFGARGAGAPRLIVIGAMLFFVSDLAVAMQRIVAPGFPAYLWGLPLYYSGQLCLALGTSHSSSQ